MKAIVDERTDLDFIVKIVCDFFRLKGVESWPSKMLNEARLNLFSLACFNFISTNFKGFFLNKWEQFTSHMSTI